MLANKQIEILRQFGIGSLWRSSSAQLCKPHLVEKSNISYSDRHLLSVL